jgi:hypothetical protein
MAGCKSRGRKEEKACKKKGVFWNYCPVPKANLEIALVFHFIPAL